LGALLAGHREAGLQYAFASIDARHMITDGRMKLMCAPNESACALFDLVADPRETQNVAALQPNVVRTLRPQLDAFLGSIARTEAVTVSEGVRLPEVLARAKLSGTADVSALLPLLG